TILSRCQRFDFSAIGESSIAQRLGEIAVAEGFDVSEDALELVARRARGSMRDSQSLFDQLLAFSDGTVTAEDVHRMLGTADDDLLVQLFSAIVEKRPAEVLRLVDGAIGTGVQAGELMDQAIAYARDLMVIAAGGDTVPLAAVASRHRTTLGAQAQTIGMHSVMAGFQILATARGQMFRSTFARTLLEMAFVQVSLLENLSAVSDLLSGRIPALPTAVGPSGDTVTREDRGPDEKKNTEPVAPAGDSIPSPVAPASRAIEFTEEKLPQILSQVISTVGFAAAAGLRKAHALAISGPNRVDVLLDPTYDFARKTLEQAEHRGAVETALQQLTGLPITVGIRLSRDPSAGGAPPANRSSPLEPTGSSNESAAEVTGKAVGSGVQENRTKPSGKAIAGSRTDRPGNVTPSTNHNPPPATNLIAEVDPSKDAFVQQVIDVFGAKVVRITAGPAVKSASGEAESSESDV
ncbi:MAG: hypothetical protein KDA85_00540, partial [Planctomycetaceae bacterium]|nr:hypothetical protein [Planctomycetaceae bacterium]